VVGPLILLILWVCYPVPNNGKLKYAKTLGPLLYFCAGTLRIESAFRIIEAHVGMYRIVGIMLLVVGNWKESFEFAIEWEEWEDETVVDPLI